MTVNIFLALASLKFVAIGILGEPVTTPRKNKYLLFIWKRLPNLVRTVPLKSVTAKFVTKAFWSHWFLTFEPSQGLLPENGKQFTSWFFQHVCKAQGDWNRLHDKIPLANQCSSWAVQQHLYWRAPPICWTAIQGARHNYRYPSSWVVIHRFRGAQTTPSLR